jgi:hypothetical protein
VNKYRNKKVIVEDYVFDSIAESRRYKELKLLLKAGEISDLKLQKKYLLIPKQKDERPTSYIADFYYIENGKEVVEDVKSKITAKKTDYIIKRKLFKQKYPEIKFREIIY